MSPITRRLVVVGSAAGAASLLVPVIVRSSIARSSKDGVVYEITDWIVIASTGEVTLGLSQPEVGQGSYTVLPQILADELDADWQHVTVRFVTGKAAYKIAFKNEAPTQKEGASMSTTSFYQRLRTAGAAARDVLTRAAAEKWNVAASECRTESGFVIAANGNRLSYGELAPAAARLPLSAHPRLKEPARFTLIGKPMPRLDSRAKSTGSARFGIDVSVPDMLNAAIRMAPSFTGAVRAIRNEAKILKMPGVHAVVRIATVAVANEEPASEHPGLMSLPRANAVCVVADHFWQAKRALDALDVVFDSGPQGGLSTAKIDALLQAALDGNEAVSVIDTGTSRQILRAKAASVIERRFVLPHIAHAPLEPVNATAHYKDGAVEVWGSIQA
ncbi:MAG: molybdopterin cofactor-binding domain-containing protein, partial [Bradyrhizobium sp.]